MTIFNSPEMISTKNEKNRTNKYALRVTCFNVILSSTSLPLIVTVSVPRNALSNVHWNPRNDPTLCSRKICTWVFLCFYCELSLILRTVFTVWILKQTNDWLIDWSIVWLVIWAEVKCLSLDITLCSKKGSHQTFASNFVKS